MDYRQAEAYVLGFTDYEKIPGIAYTAANYDLRRMEKLLAPLDNPHLGARTVHIAGTKGKGSTAAMIAQALVTAGYKTGLFTSPHLLTLRERARINNVLISEEEFASIVTRLQPIVERINKEAAFGSLTTFEILTAAVFAYFKQNHVEFQVLEVGLGGRLDATNVVRGDVCVITSISLDHVEVLGNTIAKIAAEKAGIIKSGCTVINFPQRQEALEVIEQTCRQQKAKLVQVGKDITWHRTGGDLSQQSLTLKSNKAEYNLTIPLIGDFQLENAAAAVAALEALNQLGAKISKESIIKGLNQVHWPGRLQLLQRQPLLVIDGAHNAYSMSKLIEAIKQYFRYDKCFVVFGTSCDKDIAGMAQELATFTPNITITSSAHPRAAAISVIANEFSRQGTKVTIAKNVAEALSQALSQAKSSDLILVTGSLFVVAEAISYHSKRVAQ
jgi:dihydrofolate synthase/folylpolyglutamate synthase